ncbi:hypothetical protein BGZ68_002664 [Mortierella alpina]|nr:hypothetical protein BGZ68_002664 [Mortierella alpina]
MAHSFYPNTFRAVDERLVSPQSPLLQPPTLFGVKCTEISQRAYSGQSSEMKRSFDRLQHMDIGKVEYRTIAFCAHLTVTRWEPVIPTTPAAGSPSSEGNATKDPAHAARLMSLANYVRHILSLTNGGPNTQPQAAAQPPQSKQESQKQPKPSSAQEPDRETTSSGTIRVPARGQGLSSQSQVDDTGIPLIIMATQDGDIRISMERDSIRRDS